MIGVFDSGMGGENAVKHIRRFAPNSDIVLLTDRKNAPYGTKCRGELTALAEGGISRLLDEGCERVLIACCTASTVHSQISPRRAEISIPIIEPTAKEAVRISSSGDIALLATDATVRSHAFREALGDACVLELAASPLVEAIERGERDGQISRALGEYLDALLRPIASTRADTLVLGCTHFVCLRAEIENRLKKITNRKFYTVDSSEVGARHMLKVYGAARVGEGRLKRI